MKPNKAVSATVAAIALSLSPGCSFTGSIPGFFSGTISILAGEAQRDFNISTPGQDVGSLTVDWQSGTIEVRVDDSATDITASGVIEVRAATDAEAAELLDQLDVSFTVAESFPLQVSLRVTVPEDRTVLFSADLDVVLPPGISIRVTNVNGNVTVTGNTAPTTVETTNGSVTVSEQSDDTTAETTNGNVNVDSLAGSVEATTRNGSVTVNARPQSQDSVTASSVNGQVSIFVPADTAADLTLETSFGTIDLMLEGFTVTNLQTALGPWHMMMFGSSSVSATLNGGGAQISGETIAGNVTFGSL